MTTDYTTMGLQNEIISHMDEKDIFPNESLGQHILVDSNALNFFASNVDVGGNVLEIGSGPGNITLLIAQRARRVVGIEIDRKFEPMLAEIQVKYPNVDITYNDALSINFANIIKGRHLESEWQIMANLPFHITEPFLTKLIDIPFKDAIIILGGQMARRIQIEDHDNFEFSKTGLLVQSFFDSNIVINLPETSFYPQPATDSAMVVLSPKDRSEVRGNPKIAILRKLFLTEQGHSLISKVIKEAMEQSNDNVVRDKTDRNRYDRRKLKQDLKVSTRHELQDSIANSNFKNNCESNELRKLNIPESILNKPFSNINNQELRKLVSALNKRYG